MLWLLLMAMFAVSLGFVVATTTGIWWLGSLAAGVGFLFLYWVFTGDDI